jgi:hypothetical protein
MSLKSEFRKEDNDSALIMQENRNFFKNYFDSLFSLKVTFYQVRRSRHLV